MENEIENGREGRGGRRGEGRSKNPVDMKFGWLCSGAVGSKIDVWMDLGKAVTNGCGPKAFRNV